MCNRKYFLTSPRFHAACPWWRRRLAQHSQRVVAPSLRVREHKRAQESTRGHRRAARVLDKLLINPKGRTSWYAKAEATPASRSSSLTAKSKACSALRGGVVGRSTRLKLAGNAVSASEVRIRAQAAIRLPVSACARGQRRRFRGRRPESHPQGSLPGEAKRCQRSS